MAPRPIKKRSKTTPSPKRSLDDIESHVGPSAIGALWAFSHLSLVLETSSILNSLLYPVYGSLPASRYHQPLIRTALLVSGATYRGWRGSTTAWSQWLSVLLLSLPTIQLFLFRYSGQLGASTGPLVSGLVTSFPLTLVASLVASKRLARRIDEWPVFDGLRYKEVWIGMTPQIIPAFVSLVAYTANISARSILTGTFFARSRLGTYYLLAVPQSLISPSRYLPLAALPMLHTFFFSVYSPFSYSDTHLNSTLHHHGYSLIARRESYTGYISVLDNNKDGFRVMRCDHSLLGGEWLPQPGYESQLREPVYAIFVMLEAVRLVLSVDDPATKPEVQDRLESALVIGLGIGTTPSALIAHGIDTTIIEIDPTVHDFAARYFNLPSNHTPIIEDAIVFVDRNRHQKRYHYIIHDVFTGGAEPIDLFTVEFLTGLKEMLSVDGVIAINYAGDLHLPTAHTIIHTILTVFPHCRLFRESPAPPSSSSSSTTSPLETDFTNLVLFCRRSTGAFRFRSPTKADFLGTQARKHHLLPRYEVDAAGFLGNGDEGVVRKNNTHIMKASQMRGAVGHWAVMRTVVPDAVWENW
ncbi:hypothetical protein XPA_009260 [Xanthoria parietina]